MDTWRNHARSAVRPFRCTSSFPFDWVVNAHLHTRPFLNESVLYGWSEER